MTTGDPENSIMVWKWSTGKILVADTSSFSVYHISFNPWDGTQLVAIGKSELNHVDFVEEELKLKADTLLYHVGPQSKYEHINLMLHMSQRSNMNRIACDKENLHKGLLLSILILHAGDIRCSMSYTCYLLYNGTQRFSTCCPF